MRNINRFKNALKSKGRQPFKNKKFTGRSKGTSYWLWLWGKIEGLKIRASHRLELFLTGTNSRELSVQPIKRQVFKRKRTFKNRYLLGLSLLMLTGLFSNCSNAVPQADDSQELQGGADTGMVNNGYQEMIGDYRIISAENLWAYNRQSLGFYPVVISNIRMENQQALDSLIYQHLVIGNRINQFQMNNEESWEDFTEALNRDIEAMKQTMNDSTIINKQ